MWNGVISMKIRKIKKKSLPVVLNEFVSYFQSARCLHIGIPKRRYEYSSTVAAIQGQMATVPIHKNITRLGQGLRL